MIVSGNADRGWNDPPVLLHTSTSASSVSVTPTTNRALLNKRVAAPELGAPVCNSNLKSGETINLTKHSIFNCPSLYFAM